MNSFWSLRLTGLSRDVSEDQGGLGGGDAGRRDDSSHLGADQGETGLPVPGARPAQVNARAAAFTFL